MGEKILLLGSFADSLVRFRGHLISALIQDGHRVLACAPRIDVEVGNKLRRIGAAVQDVPFRRAGLNPFSDLMLIVRLLLLLRKERPNVLFAYTIKPVVYGGLAARLTPGVRFVPLITGLGFGFTSNEGRVRRAVAVVARTLYRVALGRAAVVFFQNRDDLELFRAERFITARTRTTVVAGSGVDTMEYRFEEPKNVPAFLMIARLIRDKGVMEFAEAARLVRKQHPTARFRLAGWIDENPSSISKEVLTGWVEKGDIEFLGRLEDVRPALRDCLAYVLPSYREGTPRTVLEAMAIGRAIITTDAPGCRETVIEGVNGFLVPVKDSEALARRMCELIENPERAAAFGRESRRLVESKFDVQNVNRTLIAAMELK